jgi:AcrR family transcriptional regulator
MAKRRTAAVTEESLKPYHHGALREALLAAAEQILEREGGGGLTLRAAARRAGSSHAAPKNHFGDLTGLLSELAARGFGRFTERLLAAAEGHPTAQAKLNAIGRAYVEFAIANPGLFQLMFRGERLDSKRPNLRRELDRSLQMLTDAVAAAHPAVPSAPGELGSASAYTVRAWAMVHGFAMLLLDGRLDPLLDDEPSARDPMRLLDAMLRLD